MKPIIYYRKSLMEEAELASAEKYFSCTPLLTNVKRDDLVIYRYSLYPFAADQENEIFNIGAVPINQHDQHVYIADLINYAYDLGTLTPFTWTRLEDLPEQGPFVLKGETNSRKNDWKHSMFAQTKRDAIQVHSRLCEDSLIGSQKIYIRQYVPLKTYFTGIGGIPITKEFRFFVAFGEVLCGDYYWQNHVDDLEIKPDVNEVPKEFLQTVINRLKDNIDFFVVDVAQTETGDWIVIECNSGNQSGLSCNDPETLYSNLRRVIDKRYQ